MTIPKLIFRSLAYYRRTHVWVILGTMVSTAILVGALILGDSISDSLHQIVLDRLGKTHFVLASNNRFFNTQTAEKLSQKLNTTVAPLLETKGIAIASAGDQRMNNVRVIGVDARFGLLGDAPDIYENISPDEAIINDQLAFKLQLKKGDEFLIRIENLDFIPKDIPMASDSETAIAKRVRVKAVVSKKEFGGFNLNTDQITPNTVFVSLDYLGAEMDLEDKSNSLLVAENQTAPFSIDELNQAFKSIWSLSDAGFELILQEENDRIELRSERIFLDPIVVDSAVSLYENLQQIYTYFVNEISLDGRATPYSFVSAISDVTMSEDEIVINEWLAEDLDAKIGDKVTLSYYILGPSRSLTETYADFRVKAIEPLRGVYGDRALMPDFPGLADDENCRDWDLGIPIDVDKIRDKDEDYWDDHHGTPKAFISLAAAQNIWENRFGALTAVRFSAGNNEEIDRALSQNIDLAVLGFFFRDVKKEGLLASSQSIDFAQLFLGLSFFIILSALVLTGLLYVFSVEQRSQENGLYLALGYSKKLIRRIILSEAAIIIIIGSVLGAIGGILYNHIVLIALGTVWKGIVGTSSLHIHLKMQTILMGIFIGIIINFLTILVVTRNQLKRRIADLQKGVTKLETMQTGKTTPSLIVGILSFAGVLLILTLSNANGGQDVFAAYFAAGTLLLICGVACVNLLNARLAQKVHTLRLNLITIGIRNNVRKRFRSLAIVGLLASGLFIVFTVGSNRHSSLKDAEKRESGTGGFALVGESVMPILYDLNSEKGRDFYILNDINPAQVTFVPFRVKDGDDASCLNLNRVATPQLIGVNPDELGRRKAFSFVKTVAEVSPENPWDILNENLSDDIIPGIADQTVILWGLGKSVGDTLLYVDEGGETFKIKLVGGLANSVFQGNIVISEKAFIRKYPSISGSRFFLVDAPFPDIDDVARKITWSLQDQGVTVTPAYERLDQFAQVENTYLSIFFLLGTLGLILGSVGIGIVIRRNVSERQGELALLHAVGFSRKAIQALLLSEHSLLLGAGILIGIVSAFVAALPVFMTPGAAIPYATILFSLALVVVNGGIWTYFAVLTSTKNDLVPSLRNE